jgi:hypothetical protein
MQVIELFGRGSKVKPIPAQPSTWPSLSFLRHQSLHSQKYLSETKLGKKCLYAREIVFHLTKGSQISPPKMLFL